MILQEKGSIISTCSVSSVIGGLVPHAYTGCKHAVLGLTRNVVAELGKEGIRVNFLPVPSQPNWPLLTCSRTKQPTIRAFFRKKHNLEETTNL
ncbi:hypothetical protein J1N35_042640 [Gossypium stocksii]|uniref:Uncharacterized protein n=1 Tax=Gossypium stocksii TaxID=47602 RepID=A0A9D3U5W4_9ROSI|nr:hypothetical protein J1N35_042640 [Gossypium stocksii]